MAKCVLHIPSGGIARLPDEPARLLVASNPKMFSFTSKSAFKRSIRDKNSKTISVPLGGRPPAK